MKQNVLAASARNTLHPPTCCHSVRINCVDDGAFGNQLSRDAEVSTQSRQMQRSLSNASTTKQRLRCRFVHQVEKILSTSSVNNNHNNQDQTSKTTKPQPQPQQNATRHKHSTTTITALNNSNLLTLGRAGADFKERQTKKQRTRSLSAKAKTKN